MGKVRLLRPSFFEQPALLVASQLLGKYLVRKRNSRAEAYMIIDVEAYDGPKDRASHAYRGETSRNAPMFGPAGIWYVYLCYGMHWMLNIVTGKRGYPAAILIRGIQDKNGKKIIGPARITQLLHIHKRWNMLPAVQGSGLWIEDRGVNIMPGFIQKSPRIGVDYAGEWAKKKYHFVYAL